MGDKIVIIVYERNQTVYGDKPYKTTKREQKVVCEELHSIKISNGKTNMLSVTKTGVLYSFSFWMVARSQDKGAMSTLFLTLSGT